MPTDLEIVVYRNDDRVVIGRALVNGCVGSDGKLRMIASITDEVVIRHIQSGGSFGKSELVLDESRDVHSVTT